MTTNGRLALLRRHPSLTRSQFSTYWLHKHAATVLPWALSNGCISYIQIHNLRLITKSPSSSSPASSPPSPATLDINDYDGAAEMIFKPRPPGVKESAQSRKYYKQVVLVDERRFLVSEARMHVRFVEGEMVEGERVVVVENGEMVVGRDGRGVVDVGEAMRVWEGCGVGVGDEGEEEEG